MFLKWKGFCLTQLIINSVVYLHPLGLTHNLLNQIHFLDSQFSCSHSYWHLFFFYYHKERAWEGLLVEITDYCESLAAFRWQYILKTNSGSEVFIVTTRGAPSTHDHSIILNCRGIHLLMLRCYLFGKIFIFDFWFITLPHSITFSNYTSF